MSQAATERTAEKRTHSSEENGDSNDAVTAKAQKIDNNKEAASDEIIKDTPKTKSAENVAPPAAKNVEDAENDVEDEEGGDVEESSNAESGAEDEEGDIDDEEEALAGEDDGDDDVEGGDDDEDGGEEEEEEEEEEE